MIKIIKLHHRNVLWVLFSGTDSDLYKYHVLYGQILVTGIIFSQEDVPVM